MTDQVKRLRDFLIGGVILNTIGVGVMFLAWPSTTGSGFSEQQSGSSFWTFVGAVSTAAGGALVLVSLIGFGVKLGREAAELE